MMPGNTTTTAGSTCILCANTGVSFALHQQEQIVFFAKLLKNTLHPEGQNDLDIASVISLVPSLYVFCSTCYNKVLRAKESFDALNRLQRTLRQAQVEVQAQILSSYYASISNRSSSDYIDKVRSDLVQRLIFNLATTADDGVRPPHEIPEPAPSSFPDEDFFQFEDDDVQFPLSDPIAVNQEENAKKFMVPTSSSSSSLLVSEATHSRDRQAKRSSARIQKHTVEDSNEKKPATGGYKLKTCTVSLGPRVIPLKCVNAECGETFWTDVLLRRHLKLHRVREQCHSDDRGIRIVTVKRQQRRTHSRRVVKVPSARCTIRKPRRKVRSEKKRGSTSVLMTLFDKSNTVSYPTKCPLENCFSSRTFENRDYLRTHINRMHWDLDPNPPKKPPGHVTQVEIDVMTSLHSRTLPSQCPLDDCWLNETYDTLRALQGHVRQHLHVTKMHQEEQPAEMRRELYAAHYLDYPAYCYAESCHYRSTRPFGNKEMYKRHIRDVHYKVRTSRNLFNFDKQNKLFHELQAHYRSLQELTFPAKCFIEGCEDETYFGREYDLRLHIKTVHYDNVQEKAGRPDEKHFNMLQMLDNIESYPAKCPMENCASKDFNSRTSLRQHLQLHIGDTFVNFSTSEETSMDVQVGDDSSKNSLDVDKEIQDAEEQEKNETASALGQQTTSPKVAEYSCDKCFRVYHTYVSLRHHQVQSHKEKMIRNHKCEHCGKVFASRSSYKNHIHIRHSGAPATFLCSFCPKTFKIESYLKLHLRRHTGEYKFFCGCCPSGFLLRSELEDHERGQHWKELGIEPIKCDICGRFFTRGGILNAHRKLHSEAAFCCTECDYKTGFRNDLAEHVATVHRTETPFQCQTCGKAFKLARRLRQHMRSHVIEYPHICVPCNKPYASARQLRVHNERKHGAVPSTAPRGILVEGL